MQKKILLLGSSYSAVDFLLRLKKRGHHVTVCGAINNDPCHALGDSSFFVDYSKPERIDEVLTGHHFDHVIPSCNDYSYLTAAEVSENHRLKGIDTLKTARILHTKDAFRAFTTSHGFRVPRRFENLSQATEYLDGSRLNEIIVKPCDSFSGKGVSRVAHSGDIQAAVGTAKNQSRSDSYVLEEFVKGSLHSHSAFIRNRKVLLDFFVDEYCLAYPYQVDSSNHPSYLNEQIREDIRKEINRLCETLDLVDGLLHTQFIANNGDFWIIECMRRCPGDLYGNLIQLSTGLDYQDWYIRGFIQEDYLAPPKLAEPKPILRYTVSSMEELTFGNYSSSIQRPTMHYPLKISGEGLKPAPYDKAAIVFLEPESILEMFALSPKLGEHFRIDRY